MKTSRSCSADGLGLHEFRPGSSAYLAEISMTATV